MTRKSHFERAHVLNAASLQAHAAIAVVASADAERPTEATATFKCSDCGTTFASNAAFKAEAGASPFCVSCGSHEVKAESDGLAPEVLPSDEHLAAFACVECGTYNVMASASVAHLKDHAHCVACGTVTNFEVAASDDEGDQQQQDQDQGKEDGDQQEQDAATKTTAGGGLANFGDKKAPPIGKEQDAADDEDQGDQQADQGDQGDQQEQDAAATKTPVKAADDQDMAVETVPLDDDELLQDDGQDEATPVAVEMSLMSAALASNPNAELQLVNTGDRLLAMLDDLPVASLAAADHPELNGVFDKAPFAQSILHASRSKGVVAALKDYGFVTSKVKMPVSAATAALVKRGVAEQTAKLQSVTAALSDDLTQSLSIAAAGLNKGFWKSKANPLKAALAQSLAGLGVSNPNRLLTNVFASAGDAYVKTLLQTALELSAKPVEFRNELSASLSDMQVQAEASTDVNDLDDEDEGDHEFRAHAFEVPARAIAATASTGRTPQGAAPVTASIRAIAASVGGSAFKRF